MAAANLKSTRMVGCLSPRSIKLTNVRSISAANASCSCVSPDRFRTSRNTLPNAKPGSKTFLPVFGRNHHLALSLRLRTIVIICEIEPAAGVRSTPLNDAIWSTFAQD